MIVAILQARMSSSRLPGKVLRTLCGKPMLLHQIERIQQSQHVQKLVVATSEDPSDDVLAQVCSAAGIAVYRGSLADVLDRFYQAAQKYNATQIVRLTGDCPLTDPEIIDQVITTHLQGEYDYTSSALHPSYPDGLDAEIIRMEALEIAWKDAKRKSEREHVTYYIYQHPELFRLGEVCNPIDLSHLRWTVDEEEDFRLVDEIYRELYEKNRSFRMRDILSLCENKPELMKINSKFRRNEGLEKSLYEEKMHNGTI